MNRYARTFPGMITQWRSAFGLPEAYFGFVQLSTWCGDGELIAEMRTEGQMAALALSKVGYSTNVDHGAGCDIHPPPKQYCAKRLAASALALEYGRDVAWQSPSFASQAAMSSAGAPSVTVALADVSSDGLRDDVYPYNYLGGAFDCDANAGKCAWAELQLADGSWHNASITADGASLVLSIAGMARGTPVASRYGWGAVPMLSVYDRLTGLPVLPWYEELTTAPHASA